MEPLSLGALVAPHTNLNRLRTGDADLRFYITTVQDDANLRF